jgi:hypothetical protein
MKRLSHPESTEKRFTLKIGEILADLPQECGGWALIGPLPLSQCRTMYFEHAEDVLQGTF